MPRPKRSVPMCRYTAWIAERERDALDELADREGCSVNFLVRTAIRDLLQEHGLLASRLSQVTNESPAGPLEARA